MKNKQQSEALRLAYAFADDETYVSLLMMREAAAELRRLHAESEQHLQELAAYRFTVDNLRARVAELEAQVAAAQKAVPTAKSGRQVIVDSGALQMVLNALERDALEGKQVRAEMRLELMQSINYPTQQGMDALDAARYRWLRERDLETVHKGGVFAGMTPENYVINGVDLDAAIDAAIAAQAKQGAQANC